jgi:hypothetical protein
MPLLQLGVFKTFALEQFGYIPVFQCRPEVVSVPVVVEVRAQIVNQAGF